MIVRINPVRPHNDNNMEDTKDLTNKNDKEEQFLCRFYFSLAFECFTILIHRLAF